MIEWTKSVEARGAKVRMADPLHPDAEGVRITAPAGKPIVTDGPFVETKEWVAGFWIIDAPDLDVALRLAAAGSKACDRKVEVRPFLGE